MGADYQDGTCHFTVWAPNRSRVTLWLTGENQHLAMDPAGGGYWAHVAEGFEPGTLYMYELDGEAGLPDSASHYQPDGVFGASQVIDHDAYRWSDRGWRGLDLKDLVFYELHVGTFTGVGTFKAAAEHVAELCDFGVNAIELLPIAQFSGKRNWGYDGVFPFAVQNSYGRPDDLKALVDVCHQHGVALFVDFVYNHLGPEGNCLNNYAPYFPSTSMGQWGSNLNLDGEQNGGVRNYFLENTLHWLSHYHLDGIRLDAIYAMHDSSACHFLAELNQKVHHYAEGAGRKIHLVAESGYNIPQVLTPIEKGGWGFDGQWLDDYQHALFALLTGEKEGYYSLYGGLPDLADALSDAYVYVGQEPDMKRRLPSESYRWIPAWKLVVFSQNHDQVGNRLSGDRLSAIAGTEAAKLAAGVVLLSPYVPLLFMGEEYGETAPFLFFTDYQNPELGDAVREGRIREFAHFHWQSQAPDPQSAETYERSKLNWQLRYSARGEEVASYYRALLMLRRKYPLFRVQAERQIRQVSIQGNLLFMDKQGGEAAAGVVANFGKDAASYAFPFEGGGYSKIFDSADYSAADKASALSSSAAEGETQVIGGFGLAVYYKEPQETLPVG
ncbi:MAG: malto-oligosyltrehalose trehalohydrolase [Candidatus Bathyarchaeota archaeon]|nr:malto-oligosyltrehalose trehalohydrolase [Candidatus Bathyarchaeota archaeon]